MTTGEGVQNGARGHDQSTGTDGSDRLGGGGNREKIFGSSGYSTLRGGGGEADNDQLYGGGDDDTFYVNGDDEWLDGRAVDDTLEGAAGRHCFVCGPGGGNDNGFANGEDRMDIGGFQNISGFGDPCVPVLVGTTSLSTWAPRGRHDSAPVRHAGCGRILAMTGMLISLSGSCRGALGLRAIS